MEQTGTQSFSDFYYEPGPAEAAAFLPATGVLAGALAFGDLYLYFYLVFFQLCFRFNGVSDGASLRAVAELTKLGAFRGSFGVEPNDPGRIFYENLLEQIYSQQSFRSVLSSLILASAKGEYGKIVPGWKYICFLFHVFESLSRAQWIPCERG